jgi:hypothetical protein
MKSIPTIHALLERIINLEKKVLGKNNSEVTNKKVRK